MGFLTFLTHYIISQRQLLIKKIIVYVTGNSCDLFMRLQDRKTMHKWQIDFFKKKQLCSK